MSTPKKSWPGKLEIRAMPTIIAFKDGQEKDRVVGYRDPRGLLDWLRGLERGRPISIGCAGR